MKALKRQNPRSRQPLIGPDSPKRWPQKAKNTTKRETSPPYLESISSRSDKGGAEWIGPSREPRAIRSKPREKSITFSDIDANGDGVISREEWARVQSPMHIELIRTDDVDTEALRLKARFRNASESRQSLDSEARRSVPRPRWLPNTGTLEQRAALADPRRVW